MNDDAIVDLLLVRLGGEEEQERVKELLMSELHFSEEQAEKAASESPTMIMEGLQMGKARVIQNRLYPYVDLLPRLEEAEVPEPQPEPQPEPETEAETHPRPRRPSPEPEPSESASGGLELDDGSASAVPAAGPEAESRPRPGRPSPEPEPSDSASGGLELDDGSPKAMPTAVPEGEARPRTREPESPGTQAKGLELDDGSPDVMPTPEAEAEARPRPKPEGPTPETEPPEDSLEHLEYDDGSPDAAPSRVQEDEEGSWEENIVVTSAAEEMRQIERCHICGRTPPEEEKLAPCRTCGKLTCRDCFDRTAHVCVKCAQSGKYVDRPVQMKKEPVQTAPAPSQVTRSGAAPTVAMASPKKKLNLTALVSVVVVIVAAAAFYLVDPLDLFASDAGSNGGTGAALVHPDTASVAVADTAASADTALTSDTSAVQPDTIPQVHIDENDPLGLSLLSLPAAAQAVQNAPSIPTKTRSPSRNIEVLRQDLSRIAPNVARIAAAVPITIDAVTLIRTNHDATVLAVSILHPEEDTKRYDFLRMLGEYLKDSMIDELAFYYRETPYYDGRAVAFPNEHFAELKDASGTYGFQALAGCTSQEEWELLSTDVHSWMTELED
jgi:uncharacterized protein YlaI